MKTFATYLGPVVAGVLLTVLFTAFTVHNYLSAAPLAAENLNGLGHTLAAAIENMAVRDSSFASLRDFHAPDLAYFSIIDSDGIYLFHSNKTLVGTRVSDHRYLPVIEGVDHICHRTRLGTGEVVYEVNMPLHLPQKLVALRLALHTYRADAVIRRARLDAAILISLMVLAWGMMALLYKLERKAEYHRQERSRAERMAKLGEMGAVLAHEIRNPLSGIRGFAELMHDQLESDLHRESAALIMGEADRLESLVDELLTYASRYQYRMKNVNISAVIEDALALVLADARTTAVVTEIETPRKLMVRCDGDRMQQVFLNLFKNAIQAMEETGGCLRVKAARKGGRMVVEVADTGLGIATDHLHKVFEPYFTTKTSGTGLGLPICKKIIEDHGGDITVKSEASKGTIFNVKVPLKYVGTSGSC